MQSGTNGDVGDAEEESELTLQIALLQLQGTLQYPVHTLHFSLCTIYKSVC